MRRAAMVLVVLLAAFVSPHPSRGQSGRTTVDGAGLIDYSSKPNFQVGSWVRYRTTSKSLQGFEDDYTMTVLIAGEENWWGERCFWVETWNQDAGGAQRVIASLVSYEAFGDTMTRRHMPWFLRKAIENVKEDGTPEIVIHRRDAGDFRVPPGYEPDTGVLTTWDTLGTAETTVPAGTFANCLQVRERNYHMERVTRGDSSIYYERTEDRTRFRSPKVPITGFAREDIDDVQKGKSWRLGHSSEGELRVLERAQGSMVLIGSGQGDLEALVVPERYRRPVAATPTPSPPKKVTPGVRKPGARSG
jgi:hypothetical protein